MSSFTIEVNDKPVQDALKALAARVHNMQPVLRGLGDRIVERAKDRFRTSTGADGVKWKNSDATVSMLTARLAGSKSNRKKDGRLNAKGSRALANKKPLIASGTLQENIVASATASSLTAGTSSVTRAYAAIHQFGGKAGIGHNVNIPARPYMPIRQDGSLYPKESELILHDINTYLMEGL